MPVDDRRGPAVLRGPVEADGQAVLVGLAGRLAVEREVANAARAAPLHVGAHPGVRHDEPPAVEDVVAHERVEKGRHLLHELRRLLLELRNRLGEPVGEAHVLPSELPLQLHVVVPRHAQRGAGLDHPHHEAEDAGRVGAAVDEIAEEDRLPAVRMAPFAVPEPRQERPKLRGAAVDVADDVERPRLSPPVVVERDPLDRRLFDLLGRRQGEDVPEPLAPEPAQRLTQRPDLAPDDVGAEGPVGPRRVSLVAEPLGEVEDDRQWEAVELACEGDERLSGLGLDVRRVDHREPPGGEPLLRDEVEDLERVVRRPLVVLVVRNETAAEVRREDLGRQEVLPRERRLPGPRGPDEDDEREVREGDLHASALVKSAICVGAPTSGSTGPTGANRTA